MLSKAGKIVSSSFGVLLACLVIATPVSAQTEDFSKQQKELIKNMIREYLFKNPQALKEAIIELQAFEQRQQQQAARQAISDNGENIYRSPYSFVAGNPDGDVTLVEFFDYNCGFCKRSMKDIKALLKTDNKLKIVFKEFPILSQGSVFAARAAMASMKQGKYLAFHEALMQLRGSADQNSVMETAEEVGLDIAKLKEEMKADYITKEIATAQQVASAIGINGTPAFVLGDKVIGGAVGFEELARQIALVRAKGS